MGQQPQPSNNWLLCGGGPRSRANKWVANHGNWPTPQHPPQPTPVRAMRGKGDRTRAKTAYTRGYVTCSLCPSATRAAIPRGSCCAHQRKDRAREFGGERLLCAPVREMTPQADNPNPPAAVGERYLTAGLGWPLGRTWPTAKAVAFLCVESTQRSETGQVRGLRWHNRPREWKGKEW